MQKWVSVWGNAVSIAENRPERYAKDITLRYPIVLPFSGSGVRLTFDNYCGTEPVTLEKVTIFCGGAFHPVTFGGERRVTLPAEGNVISDTLETPVTAGEKLLVSFYLQDFTLMRSVVFTCGALSGGLYANGDETENLNISMDTSRKTQLTYFLSNVSVRTAPENRAIVCYGDSITAQDWPDDLQLRCRKDGFEHTAIIRRATSGSRILREYHCLTYESYGLMGAKRFAHEVPTDGADAVIIQQGINDICRMVTHRKYPAAAFHLLHQYAGQARHRLKSRQRMPHHGLTRNALVLFGAFRPRTRTVTSAGDQDPNGRRKNGPKVGPVVGFRRG